MRRSSRVRIRCWSRSTSCSHWTVAMPVRPTRGDADSPLREMAALAIADNPDLKQQLTRIVGMMLADVERTFLIGDPKAKAVYVRQIVPTLIRSLSEADAAAVDSAERQAFE